MNDSEQRARLVTALRQLLARSPVRRHLILHLAEGCSRKVIAQRMNKSPHTIDAHLKAIYRQIGISDRAMLVLLSVRLFGLDSPPP